RRKQHRHAALHVKGASPPYLSVDQITTERRMPPLAGVGRDDVDMAVEEDGWRLTPTLDTSNEVRPIILHRHVPAWDSGLREQPACELDAGSFVAGRVRCIESD